MGLTPAQRRKRCLAAQARRVVPRRDQQGRCGLGSDAKAREQSGGGQLRQAAQLLVEFAKFFVQCRPAFGQQAQRHLQAGQDRAFIV